MRATFQNGDVCEEVFDLVQEFGTNFAVSHFATAEHNDEFHVVTVIQEFSDFAEFNVKVVVADFEANFNRFELGLFSAGFLAIFGFFFQFLILIFAPIDNANNGRIGVRGDFHEVDSGIASEEPSITTGHDAELFSILTNNTDLRIADFTV